MDGVGETERKAKRLINNLLAFRVLVHFVFSEIVHFVFPIIHREYDFWPFVKKKFMRLMVPSIFFSLIYYFCFEFTPAAFDLKEFIMLFIAGTGHMWFLPMIFWCFVAIRLMGYFRLNEIWCLIALLVVSPVLSALPSVPGHFFHYFVYFYMGCVVWRWRAWLFEFFSKPSRIVVSILLFLVLFVGITYGSAVLLDFKESNGINGYNLRNLSLVSFLQFIEMILATAGIFAVFVVSNFFINGKGIKPASWVYDANRICYGVYIYHQFLLNYLYYYTSVPAMLGGYWLPIVSSVVILAVSVLFARLTLRTRAGRFLLG